MKIQVTSAWAVALLALTAAAGSARAADKLTLAQAEAIALQNQPRLRAANYTAMAARQVPTEFRSAFFPNLQASFTGADAPAGTRIAAGGLNNPSILGRYSNGITGSQLITDFGRTQNLVGSAQAQANAAGENAQLTREDVLLQVDQAFYNTLRAQAVLRVAEEAVATRQTLADQVTALADAKLKSALDVSFAEVTLSQAKLALAKAQNDGQASLADLSAALGYNDLHQYELVDESASLAAPPDFQQLLATAKQQRPDLAGQEFQVQAAHRFTKAERDLWFPSLSVVAGAGLIPYGNPALRDRYAAAGFNLTVPVFNGFLFSARHTEARLKEQAEEANLTDLQNRVTRDVRVAWLNADNAYRRLDLTAQLLAEASQALELAQARYNLGLSSIVELSQAQLNQTEAEIEQASAKYDYQMQLAMLKYQSGQLR